MVAELLRPVPSPGAETGGVIEKGQIRALPWEDSQLVAESRASDPGEPAQPDVGCSLPELGQWSLRGAVRESCLEETGQFLKSLAK